MKSFNNLWTNIRLIGGLDLWLGYGISWLNDQMKENRENYNYTPQVYSEITLATFDF